jgi:hypothetical protein
MRKHVKSTGAVSAALLISALAFLALAGPASAKLTGEFQNFEFCPYTNPIVERCFKSTNTGGEVKLGKKSVPVEQPVVLQGGLTEPAEEGPEAAFAKFVEPTNKIALSKAKQNVPGGLAGIVPEAGAPFLVKALIKFFFENKITGLTSTLELAKPATDIRVSNEHFGEQIGVALKMPVKIHLENPFLGKSCFVGSSTSPITFELRTGKTSPPKPNEPITGKLGTFEFLEMGRVLKVTGAELVDNSWSAPGASGCGGIISFLVNPIINSQLGTTTAGNNTAILQNTLHQATSFAVKQNNEENP